MYVVRFTVRYDDAIVAMTVEDPKLAIREMLKINNVEGIHKLKSPAVMEVEVIDSVTDTSLCICPSAKAAYTIAAAMNEADTNLFDNLTLLAVRRLGLYRSEQRKLPNAFAIAAQHAHDAREQDSESESELDPEHPDYVVKRALEKNREAFDE